MRIRRSVLLEINRGRIDPPHGSIGLGDQCLASKWVLSGLGKSLQTAIHALTRISRCKHQIILDLSAYVYIYKVTTNFAAELPFFCASKAFCNDSSPLPTTLGLGAALYVPCARARGKKSSNK